MTVRLLAPGLVALVLAAPAATRSALDRSTQDRPDDVTGPQIHAVYAVPADGRDRELDTNGTIAASVNNWETWLAGQTGGLRLRLDTYQGAPDVSFFRLGKTDAQLAAMGAFVRDEIESELVAADLTKPGKLYAVYYDGNSTYACGGGAWPPALPGIVGAVYLPSTFWNTSGLPCYDPARSLGGLALMDLAMLHELVHTLGFVATCAPHFTASGHVADSPTDLMYAGPEAWRPSVLDVGHDDYFDAHIEGCPDLADSPYLNRGDDRVALAVTVVGRGTVTSRPGGISCAPTCGAAFAPASAVSLTARPAAGFRLGTWSGACTGSLATCTVTMDAAKTVKATFASIPKRAIPKCRKGQRSTRKRPCHR